MQYANKPVRESVAMEELLCAHVCSKDNYADILTKVLTGQKQRDLVQQILYDIYDNHSKTTEDVIISGLEGTENMAP